MSDAEGPGPGESQREFEQRTGQQQEDVPAEQAASSEPAAPQHATSVSDLRAQLEAAEAAERAQQPMSAAAAPAGGGQSPAQAIAAGKAGQSTVPAGVAQAPVGSLAQAGPEQGPEREITHSEPILAQGASGDAVVRLVRLLAAAGYATNSVVNATNPGNVLDASIMADVRRLRQDHPEADEPDELFTGRDAGVHELQGDWIGPHTWQTLYDLANAGGQ